MLDLTPKQKSRYIEQGGVKCPFCNNDDITGSSVEIDSGMATQEVSCETCCETWMDLYSLVGVDTS